MVDAKTMTEFLEAWKVVSRCEWKRFLFSNMPSEFNGNNFPEFSNDFETLSLDQFLIKYSVYFKNEQQCQYFEKEMNYINSLKNLYFDAYDVCKALVPDFENIPNDNKLMDWTFDQNRYNRPYHKEEK